MSEITVYCSCGSPDCPIKLHVEWSRDHIIVTIWDGLGTADKTRFTYYDFLAHLEVLDSYPLNDNKTDIYYFEFMVPMWSTRGGTTTFHLRDTNRDTLIAKTKEMANAYGITL